jgi:hypothetical protein
MSVLGEVAFRARSLIDAVDAMDEGFPNKEKHGPMRKIMTAFWTTIHGVRVSCICSQIACTVWSCQGTWVVISGVGHTGSPWHNQRSGGNGTGQNGHRALQVNPVVNTPLPLVHSDNSGVNCQF